jgi:ABC-2 type transport system permease protein
LPGADASIPAPPLVSPQAEAAAFHRMRWRQAGTRCGQALRDSRFRLILIAGLSALLWLSLFWLFVHGFQFLDQAVPDPSIHEKTVETIFGTFFVTLMVMLVFSAGIILYSSLFRGRDIPLLLTLPARPERIFLHKFQEATIMSSWAFVLLGSPMLLAYGLVEGAPWYYYAVMLPFLVSFVYIPAAIGAVLCVEVVYRIPRRRFHVLGAAVILAVLTAVVLGRSLASGSAADLLTLDWFQDMLGRLRVTEHRVLPSWWLSTGLLEASRQDGSESVLFLCLMISNALFFRQVSIWTAAKIYRGAYDRLLGNQPGRKRARLAAFDLAASKLFPFLTRQVRLLIVKDLRLFRRDPVQWSQFLIFLGLLAFYFVNIHRLTYDIHYQGWVNLVSFLNVSVVGLLLSTFTTRFIFPMLSLEGRRFWVLGLVSLRRETILWSKFLFAVGGSIVPCSLLVLLSDVMLQINGTIVAIHQLTCVILCFGLAGIAVGLGAKMPDLRESSPSRIAAGFGGTLCLVLSTLYIVAVVLLTSLPSHFYLSGQGELPLLMIPRLNLHSWLKFSFFGGLAASTLLGIFATTVPLWIGFRSFRKLEF